MSEFRKRSWIQFESPWICQPGTIRLMQSHHGANAKELSNRAWRNELTQPYIFETLFERRMHFTNDATQSAMLLSDPEALVCQYTRKMMAFLLFNPDPKHIVIIGLGGGSLAKFCYRHLPRTRITVVEINAEVIALRDEFCIPKDDRRFRVVQDDGAEFIEKLDEPTDVLLVDAFDADGVAPSMARSAVYANAARRLEDDGVLVMNFWGASGRCVDNLEHARAAFGESLLLVPVSGESNVLLFAFKRAPPHRATDELNAMASRLKSKRPATTPCRARSS